MELAVLARSCDDQLVLARIVSTRLFEIDVLARVPRENRSGCVPVVWRRNGNRIDVLVFEDSAEVADGLGWRRLQRRRVPERLGENVGINVAKVCDRGVGTP